jgi:transposase InsO family protein
MARSTYYYHFKRRQSDKYVKEKDMIMRLHKEHYNAIGYRKMNVLLRKEGHILNHKTILKLMKILNIRGKMRKNKYKSYKGGVGKIAPNLINRNFKASMPYGKLTTDVSEFAVCGEKVYLSPILDMFSNEILCYSISKSPNFWQIKDMLNKLKLPSTIQPIFHSDQGWQYQMKEYQNILEQKNIIQSMSRKGNCLDNSIMESFFGRLKVEMFYGEKFESIDEFVSRLENYLDYYNNKRVSLKLNGLTPIELRNQSL